MVGEVDKERLLFAYQISKQIVHGSFPLNKELAFELTALMAQVKIFDIFGLFWLFSVFFGHISSEECNKIIKMAMRMSFLPH